MTDSTAVSGDGVITIPGTISGVGKMAGMDEEAVLENRYFLSRLKADRDRHSSNATTFEKILELQYASSMTFRDANSARVVLESGSGRTRAETNNPGNTAAPKE